MQSFMKKALILLAVIVGLIIGFTRNSAPGITRHRE